MYTFAQFSHNPSPGNQIISNHNIPEADLLLYQNWLAAGKGGREASNLGKKTSGTQPITQHISAETEATWPRK